MWRYDLHVHTNYSSDGQSSVKDIIHRAEQIGLSGIAITDHDVLKGTLEAKSTPSEIEVIPGCEITLKNGRHVIGLYLTKEINENILEPVISEIHNQGGLAMLPHPFRAKSGLLSDNEISCNNRAREIAFKFDLIEVYNPTCSDEENLKAFDFWRNIGGTITKVSASDAHSAWQLGIGQTFFTLKEPVMENTNKLKFRELIKIEQLKRGIFIGTQKKILTTFDGRPLSIRFKQLVKEKFPFLPILRKYFLSTIFQRRSEKKS